MKIEYSEFSLANGLKVIVHEDFNAFKVAVNITYHVGSRDELASRTGLAHLFEHLMFSGSINISDYDRHVQRIGGECNAFTNSDITNYYLTCPANQIETAFWLESDRMLQLDFSEKNLSVQKSVVCEEFKQRYLNQPYGDAYLLLRPLVYRSHPYQWATIGKELSHIEEVSLQEIEDFFYNYYAPSNATLVVAGNVTCAQVQDLAEKWFGHIPKRQVIKNSYAHEVRQTEARTITVRKPVPQTAVYKAYQMPARTANGYYAVDMITDLLSSGKASRLYRYLVKEKQVAAQASAFTWGLFDIGMLSINAQIAEGKTIEEYEQALDEALNGLFTVDENELARMKHKLESSEAFDKTELLNRAMSLSIYNSLGHTDLINTVLSRYQSLRVEDIYGAAKEYLRKDNCSTLYYLSEGQ